METNYYKCLHIFIFNTANGVSNFREHEFRGFGYERSWYSN